MRRQNAAANEGAEGAEPNDKITQFLDNLPDPETDPETDPDTDDDGDDGDDDDGDDDDDDDDDDDGSGSGEGEALPNAATMHTTPHEVAEGVSVASVDSPTPKKRGRPRKTPEVQEDDSTFAAGPQKSGLFRRDPNSFVPANPRGVRGSRTMSKEDSLRSPALNKAREYQMEAYKEIDSMLAQLNFASREYEIRVERVSPDRDENDVPCRGHLATYNEKVSVADIQRRFGGGVFQISIYGPHPTSGVKGILKRERVEVAGNPLPMKKNPQNGAESSQSTSATAEVLRAFADSNERNNQRMISMMEKAQSNPSIVETLLPTITPLFERMMSKSDETMRLFVQQQQEDRRREEERRREDEKKAEERRREEREREERSRDERRREEDKREERRREEERKAEDARREERRQIEETKRLQQQEEREKQREERERIREEARLEAAERQRQHEREMTTQSERSKDAQQQQQQYMQMMQNFTKVQLDNLYDRQQNSSTDTLVKQMLGIKDLMDSLSGSDREPTGIEKITDGVERVVTAVMPVAKQMMANRGSAPQQSQQSQQPQQRPIAVDIGPRNTPNNQQPQIKATVSNPSPRIAPQEQTQQTQTQQTQTQEEDIINDLTDFVAADANDDMIVSGTNLIKNVDLAVRRSLSAEEIVEKILKPFEVVSPMVASMVGGFDTDQLLEFVEKNVPPSWAILSPRGEALIVEAFELWKDGRESAAEGEAG